MNTEKSPLRILIIEDQPVQSEALCRFFKARFTNVICEVRQSIQEGRAIYQEFKAQITIIDAHGTGAEEGDYSYIDGTGQGVWHGEPGFDPPVIIISGDYSPQMKIDAMSAGAEACYSKKFLLELIEGMPSLDGIISAAIIVSTITDAVFRNELPQRATTDGK